MRSCCLLPRFLPGDVNWIDLETRLVVFSARFDDRHALKAAGLCLEGAVWALGKSPRGTVTTHRQPFQGGTCASTQSETESPQTRHRQVFRQYKRLLKFLCGQDLHDNVLPLLYLDWDASQPIEWTAWLSRKKGYYHLGIPMGARKYLHSRKS
jgi:hypothetical protein